MTKHKILITGAAGFIGFHLADLLKSQNFEVWLLDNLNPYYDVNLKLNRLRQLGIEAENVTLNTEINSTIFNNVYFFKADLAEHQTIIEFMVQHQFDYVVNLAAQAGVRYSLENPKAYTHSNIDGFLSILEGCRHANVKHLVYASSSSVYGLNETMPLNEDEPTEHPMSLYAATKKANEMMAHSYSHLYRLPTTGLRFFTVYGPWGRPDMALFLFADAMIKGKSIDVFNHGKMIRDFTFVADIVKSVAAIVQKPAMANPSWNGKKPSTPSSSAPYQIFNIGNSSPVELMVYIEELEKALGITAAKTLKEIQPGDIPATHANVQKLSNYVGFKPQTTVQQGIQAFVLWYVSYYNIQLKTTH